MHPSENLKAADLHVHTVYSDGMFHPHEVVETALKLGLKAIAITDHDCVEGVEPTIECARGSDLEVIPGIEMSAAVDDREVHLLGYFIDRNNKLLLKKLEEMKENRITRIRKMIALLNGKGIDIAEKEVFDTVDKGIVGRLHLAYVMKEKGLVETTNEAFNKFIGDGKPCYVKHEHFDYVLAIRMILDAGGVPALAHPGLAKLDGRIPEFVEKGLRAIEVYHSEQKTFHNERYLKLAKKYSLIPTGGSDCHGLRKGEILMGTVKVGMDIVETLREESRVIRESGHPAR